jgi:hypothetical protein
MWPVVAMARVSHLSQANLRANCQPMQLAIAVCNPATQSTFTNHNV